MISDGDSRAYETIKNIYVDTMLKDLGHSHFSNSASLRNIGDESVHDSNNSSLFLSKEKEKVEENLVIEEDCVNHVKKRVLYHLNILKNRYCGFEDVSDVSTVLNQTDQQKKVRSNTKSPKYLFIT